MKYSSRPGEKLHGVSRSERHSGPLPVRCAGPHIAPTPERPWSNEKGRPREGTGLAITTGDACQTSLRGLGGFPVRAPFSDAAPSAASEAPVFAGTLRHADNLSRALDARCYEGGSGRTHYRVMRIAGRDWVAMTLAAAYVAALVALGVLAH
ncbi:hypothetical protein EMO90_00075 [Bifidobacterium vespertilionis]|uniref:Energy-coupling factor transporter transmembrane protein EcfT n=1 Tax=Bifidobacterium vespertilionis TaxID=2562524 RepID=A0A5J5E010_9BIFI|nr:hypothetical protein EMO90_00075 [Bifidobacterium vespertilionis]KAA8824503.1 hypothetical protein EM848_01450 [Bifidobacterium vespertilionis]